MYCTCCGSGRVCWWALGCVEGSDTTAGPGAHVDQTAAIAKRSSDGVDDDGNLGQRLFDGSCDFGVFVVNNACDLEGGLGVESFGCGVGGLRREIVEVFCASVDGCLDVGACSSMVRVAINVLRCCSIHSIPKAWKSANKGLRTFGTRRDELPRIGVAQSAGSQETSHNLQAGSLTATCDI